MPEHRVVVQKLPEWEQVLKAERERSSFSLEGLAFWRKPFGDMWLQLRSRIEKKSLLEQAEVVNAFFNIWEYREDVEIWGKDEHWANPVEFVNRSGDCEDYAIAKYFALRDLGVPAEFLRIAAVWNLQRCEGHAVLFVFVEGTPYVLDNRHARVLPQKDVFMYEPRYCVNEEYLWIHRLTQ